MISPSSTKLAIIYDLSYLTKPSYHPSPLHSFEGDATFIGSLVEIEFLLCPNGECMWLIVPFFLVHLCHEGVGVLVL